MTENKTLTCPLNMSDCDKCCAWFRGSGLCAMDLLIKQLTQIGVELETLNKILEKTS